MKEVNDKVFGVMKYKHSWSKDGSILLFNKAYKINIVAEAYENESITDIQRENFLKSSNFIESNKDKIDSKLKEYLATNYDCKKPLDVALNPKTLIFEQDGSWGVLFESDYDVEDGVAFFVKKDEILVGRQDDFL